MTLAAVGPISPASIALGLAAVGSLYALHHLRARPTRQAMATLVFWREATRQQQARALRASRFSHPWTFLLLCAIALLAAAAMSAQRWGDIAAAAGRRDVIVVDVGTSMGAPAEDGRMLLRHAIDSARRDVDSLDPTALITAGAQPSMLCDFDEPAAVLKARLDQVAPAATASGSARALELAASVIGPRNGAIYWYTDRGEPPAGLPAEIVGRIRVRRQPAAADAVAIVGVTFEPSAADALSGTLRVRVAGRAARALTLDATLGDAPLPGQRVTIGDAPVDVELRDVPADGRTVSLALRDAPGAPAEHVVRYVLPRRLPLKFFFADPTPGPLRDVLASVGTEVASPEGAIVVTGERRPTPAGAIASIVVLADDAANQPADLIAPAEAAPAAVQTIGFEGARAAADAGGVPRSATPVLMAGRAVVAAIENNADGKRLYLASGLVTAAADLPRRAAFPVLMYELASELAGSTPAPDVITSLRAIDDPLWRTRDSSGKRATVYAAPTFLVAKPDGVAADVGASEARRSRPWPWTELLLAAGLTLLVVEGLLLASKKIV